MIYALAALQLVNIVVFVWLILRTMDTNRQLTRALLAPPGTAHLALNDAPRRPVAEQEEAPTPIGFDGY